MYHSRKITNENDNLLEPRRQVNTGMTHPWCQVVGSGDCRCFRMVLTWQENGSFYTHWL